MGLMCVTAAAVCANAHAHVIVLYAINNLSGTMGWLGHGYTKFNTIIWVTV